MKHITFLFTILSVAVCSGHATELFYRDFRTYNGSTPKFDFAHQSFTSSMEGGGVTPYILGTPGNHYMLYRVWDSVLPGTTRSYKSRSETNFYLPAIVSPVGRTLFYQIKYYLPANVPNPTNPAQTRHNSIGFIQQVGQRFSYTTANGCQASDIQPVWTLNRQMPANTPPNGVPTDDMYILAFNADTTVPTPAAVLPGKAALNTWHTLTIEVKYGTRAQSPYIRVWSPDTKKPANKIVDLATGYTLPNSQYPVIDTLRADQPSSPLYIRHGSYNAYPTGSTDTDWLGDWASETRVEFIKVWEN